MIYKVLDVKDLIKSQIKNRKDRTVVSYKFNLSRSYLVDSKYLSIYINNDMRDKI